MKNKALPPEQNEAARSFLRELVAARFDGNATNAARALGVSQSLVSEFLAGSRGAGMKLLSATARYADTSVDAVIGRAAASSLLPDDAPCYGNAPGRTDQERAVREEMPGVHAWVFEKARQIRGITPPNPVTKEFVVRALTYVLENSSEEEIYQQARKRMDAIVKRVNSAAETRQRKRQAGATEAPELPGVTEKSAAARKR